MALLGIQDLLALQVLEVAEENLVQRVQLVSLDLQDSLVPLAHLDLAVMVAELILDNMVGRKDQLGPHTMATNHLMQPPLLKL